MAMKILSKKMQWCINQVCIMNLLKMFIKNGKDIEIMIMDNG